MIVLDKIMLNTARTLKYLKEGRRIYSKKMDCYDKPISDLLLYKVQIKAINLRSGPVQSS